MSSGAVPAPGASTLGVERPRPPDRPVRRRRVRGESVAGWGFAAPNLVFLLVFVAIPLVGSVVTSFQQTNGFGAGRFTGLANYERLFTDPVFWRAALNTCVFTVLITTLSMAAGLGAAVLLNAALPGRAFFRTALVLPMAVSGVATALIGALLFDQNTGLLNELLRTLHLPAVSWQTGGVPAFASIVLITVWWRTGFNMLVYLAGLQGLGDELTEAAALDGAGTWQRFRFVTVPLLRPTSFFLLIVNTVFSFQLFDIVFVLTDGGPGHSTSVLVSYAYDNGFVVRDQGYAAAIGMVLLVVTTVLTVIRWRRTESRDGAV